MAAWQADGAAACIRRAERLAPAHSGSPIASIAWLVRHRPAIAERAHRFLDVHDYLVLHLTGRCVTDRSAGAVTAMVDHATGAWSAESARWRAFALRSWQNWLRPAQSSARWRPEVAQATGLAADTTVMVGGHDQSRAVVGMGIRVGWPGDAGGGDSLGHHRLDQQRDDRAGYRPRMDLNFHVVPNVRTVSQLLGQERRHGRVVAEYGVESRSPGSTVRCRRIAMTPAGSHFARQ